MLSSRNCAKLKLLFKNFFHKCCPIWRLSSYICWANQGQAHKVMVIYVTNDNKIIWSKYLRSHLLGDNGRTRFRSRNSVDIHCHWLLLDNLPAKSRWSSTLPWAVFAWQELGVHSRRPKCLLVLSRKPAGKAQWATRVKELYKNVPSYVFYAWQFLGREGILKNGKSEAQSAIFGF